MKLVKPYLLTKLHLKVASVLLIWLLESNMCRTCSDRTKTLCICLPIHVIHICTHPVYVRIRDHLNTGSSSLFATYVVCYPELL